MGRQTNLPAQSNDSVNALMSLEFWVISETILTFYVPAIGYAFTRQYFCSFFKICVDLFLVTLITSCYFVTSIAT